MGASQLIENKRCSYGVFEHKPDRECTPCGRGVGTGGEPAHFLWRCPRRAGAGMDPGALDAYRSPPPLPPFAEVLGAASTQPTTLPSTRYTSTRFPNPQGRLPEGLRPKDDPR